MSAGNTSSCSSWPVTEETELTQDMTPLIILPAPCCQDARLSDQLWSMLSYSCSAIMLGADIHFVILNYSFDYLIINSL